MLDCASNCVLGPCCRGYDLDSAHVKNLHAHEGPKGVCRIESAAGALSRRGQAED